MDFSDSPEEAAFRQEVRKFLKDELPEGLARKGGGGAMFGGGGRNRGRGGGDYFQKLFPWLNKLSERGWVAPAWPKEYGGAGLTVIEQFILSQEMATIGAPRSPNVIGLGWVGPTLIVYGTDEQKEKHLRPILDSKAWWCQGFSEPEAGSDLASLQTRAVRDGDDYVINGQKIWTSGAQIAQWMILLVRTDPDQPKHRGLSLFILPTDVPGFSAQPINDMMGLHRWHHSKLIEESNRNYGNNLIVWDLLFGSWFLPKDRRVGDLGLINRNYPLDFASQMKTPFISGLDKESSSDS